MKDTCKFLTMLMIILFCILATVNSLDNGVALTPPMGWMSWQRFRCTTDCVNYPNDCISEQLIRDMADRMAEDGYLDAGYEYVIIDDCWLATERDDEGRLQPDPDRFPSGIPALADYVHSKGLKFGIYEDIGTHTCAGYPGIGDNMELDANTFAEWGVDYLKVDGCYADTDGMEDKYAQMSQYLNQTGRPIVYSCSFPAYKGLSANYTAAVQICNLWRNYDDIQDSWDSVKDIVNWFSMHQAYLNRFAGQEGGWNDPDMLLIGNYGLSYDESLVQMTIWAMIGAPLLMSVDLRTINPEFKSILLNKEAISVDQNDLGILGLLTWSRDDVYIWTRELSDGDGYAAAFGIVSFRTGGGPYVFNITLDSFYLMSEDQYTVVNVFEDVEPFTVGLSEPLQISVNPSGAVLLKFYPVSENRKDRKYLKHTS